MSKTALAGVTALALTITVAGLASQAQLSEEQGLHKSFSGPIPAPIREVQPGAPTGWQTTERNAQGRHVILQTASSAGAPATAPTTTTTTAAPADSAASTTKKPDDSITIAESQVHKASAKAWQKYYDYLNLLPGQESLPLTLVVTNGVDGAPAFEGIRISLAGRNLASEKDFTNKVMQMKMDGTLNAGNNQLIIQAYGPTGSALQWKLNSIKPVVTSVKPEQISPGGTFVITGRNFKPGNTQVAIGESQATITTITTKKITAKAADNAPNGQSKLYVYVGKIRSKHLMISILPTPVLTSCSMLSAPPGQPLVISGKNFSAKSSENEVTLGGIACPITSVSANSISVVIPEGLQYPQWDVPIMVKTNGVQATGTLKMNIQMRAIPNDGVPEQ